jgi:hypothetical protein
LHKVPTAADSDLIYRHQFKFFLRELMQCKGVDIEKVSTISTFKKEFNPGQ